MTIHELPYQLRCFFEVIAAVYDTGVDEGGVPFALWHFPLLLAEDDGNDQHDSEEYESGAAKVLTV